MREASFLKTNADKWKKTEAILSGKAKVDPDTLAACYLDLNDDLAFSQTMYPESDTTKYLNRLASGVYLKLHGRTKERTSRLVTFWKTDLPNIMWNVRKKLLISFLIFFGSMLLGALSTAYDPEYPNIILGSAYVDQTIDNIESGDPLAIYKDPNAEDMFMAITLNNIRVSFNTFMAGFFASIGTMWLLFRNGVMVGTFLFFFYERDLLQEAMLTIWVHGTLEISAIIIAGAAGIRLGNSILFPGTLKRVTSITRGTKDAVKIVIGLVPIFIVAGFLESFVTRYTEWPAIAKLAIILISLVFILFYFVYYPYKLNRNKPNE